MLDFMIKLWSGSQTLQFWWSGDRKYEFMLDLMMNSLARDTNSAMLVDWGQKGKIYGGFNDYITSLPDVQLQDAGSTELISNLSVSDTLSSRIKNPYIDE